MKHDLIVRFAEKGVRDLEELKAALKTAMQLEYSTIPPYLCALWSIKPAGSEPGKAFNIIRQVIVEEMHHFGLAGNILYAIGGKIDLLDPGFLPKYPTHVLPGNVHQKLAIDIKHLDKDQLKVFMQIERPNWEPVDQTPAGGRDSKRGSANDQPLAKMYNSIGEFYKSILSAIEKTDESVFSKDTKQMPVFAAPDNGRVIDKASAIAAIKLILEEGEGSEHDPEQPHDLSAGPVDSNNFEFAHYYSFKEILEERQLIKSNNKWVYEGAAIPFPEVYKLKRKVSDPKFSAIHTELMRVLNYCWETEAENSYQYSKHVMREMGKIGRALVQQGKYPEFALLQIPPDSKS